MLGRGITRTDSDRVGPQGRRRPGRAGRPGVECLEGRALLSAITEFPLNEGRIDLGALTAGPDGNLWFPETLVGSDITRPIGRIGRIAPSGGLTEFPMPGVVGDVTVGPDDNLWFPLGGGIDRITPSGTFTEFQVSEPGALTVGPDGNLWFGGSGNLGTMGEVGRITPSGTVTEFPIPTTTLAPKKPVVGPDGNLWFIETAPQFPMTTPVPGQIGRITPAGVITEFPLPPAASDPGPLTVGPDGNLWFPDFASVVRITTSGVVTVFPVPGESKETYYSDFLPEVTGTLTVGPDGNLWFPEYGPQVVFPPPFSGQIGRITPAGVVTEFPIPTAGYYADALTVGPDGNLWFGANGSTGSTGEIGRITPSGKITEFAIPTAGATVGGFETVALTVGPDGNIWFIESIAGAAAIGRVNLGMIPPPSPAVASVAGVTAEHARHKTTAIVLTFDTALDPGTATRGDLYRVATVRRKRHKLVPARALKIGNIAYDAATDRVTLTLARPHRGMIQVTARAGIIAAGGLPSAKDFTEIVR